MSETVICNQAHICKKEPCHHKKPHESDCANPMTCRDFQREAGKAADNPPISACVAVSTDDHYYTTETKWCGCCGGRGYTEVVTAHKVPEPV